MASLVIPNASISLLTYVHAAPNPNLILISPFVADLWISYFSSKKSLLYTLFAWIFSQREEEEKEGLKILFERKREEKIKFLELVISG